jgi:cytidylate kinase
MPIITISRGTFSGGKDVAECLARSLDYPCIAHEVLAEAAEQYGASEAALSAALSHAPSLIDRVKRDREHYLAYIRTVLCRHARAGNFVYHGLAGHHLLAGIRHVLRVRVVADLIYRIQAAMAQLNMSSRQAESYIRKVDDERRKWTRFLYGVEWEDAGSYDVVINLEYLGASGACTAIARIAELEQFQPTPASQRALENLGLQSAVLAALGHDDRTRDADFRVRADGGVVTVEGMAKLPRMVEAAGDVVAGVEGVTQVVNQVVAFGLPM